MSFRRIWAALIAALLMLGTAAFAQESLGDVARQQRTASGKKAKKVVTNEDIPERAAPVEEKSSDASKATASADKKPAPDSPEKAPETAGPNANAKSDRDFTLARIEELKYSENAERRVIRKLEQNLAQETSEFRRRMYEESLEHAREQLEKFKQERTELEQKAAAEQKSGGGEQKPAAESEPKEKPQQESPSQ